jgi:hypothetical protein
LVRRLALLLQSGICGVRYQNEIVGLIQSSIALAHFIAGLHADEVAHSVFRREDVPEGIIAAPEIQILDIGKAVMLKPFGHQFLSDAPKIGNPLKL